MSNSSWCPSWDPILMVFVPHVHPSVQFCDLTQNHPLRVTHSCGPLALAGCMLEEPSSIAVFKIKSCIRRKRDPCNGLVKKSATISSVGQYATLNCLSAILSVTKKYQMLMCCVLLALEALPFFSSRMAL